MTFESERQCRRCERETMHILARNRTLNGSTQVGLLCSVCQGWTVDRRGRTWIPVAEVRAIGVNENDLPVASSIAPSVRCARCGSRDVELHHWAPRAYFGQECDQWPKDYLCREHHAEWHRTVTPSLVQEKAS